MIRLGWVPGNDAPDLVSNHVEGLSHVVVEPAVQVCDVVGDDALQVLGDGSVDLIIPVCLLSFCEQHIDVEFHAASGGVGWLLVRPRNLAACWRSRLPASVNRYPLELGLISLA